MPNTRLEETAYHEAGHVVAAYRFGLGLETTSIIADKGKRILGFSKSEGESFTGQGDDEKVVVLYAGWSAEKKFNPNASDQGCGSDNEMAARLIEFWGWEEAPLRQRTDELIGENWPAVEALAAALLEYGLLLEDEAIFVIAEVDKGGEWRSGLEAHRQYQMACSPYEKRYRPIREQQAAWRTRMRSAKKR